MCKLNSEFPLLKYGASSRIWERERVPVPRNPGTRHDLIQMKRIDTSENLRTLNNAWKPIFKCVPVAGNADPGRVPVLRNPGTHRDLIQMKRIGTSEHLRILESAWKPVFKRVPVPRERNPEVRERWHPYSPLITQSQYLSRSECSLKSEPWSLERNSFTINSTLV